MRTIQVTGKANLVVAPDQTKVTMTLENIKQSYADTIKKCSVDLKEVKRAIKSSGLDPKKLKTSKFYVNPSYDEYYDEKIFPVVLCTRTSRICHGAISER